MLINHPWYIQKTMITVIFTHDTNQNGQQKKDIMNISQERMAMSFVVCNNNESKICIMLTVAVAIKNTDSAHT